MIRFKWLSGDINWKQYGGKWISQKLNNGDWDYWFVLELINMWYYTGDEKQAKYWACLSAVSPDAAGKENIKKAQECCGVADDELAANPIVAVQILHDYGISAPLWGAQDNNADKLLKKARYESYAREMIFGFYMDAPKNRIGNSGWDLISGNIGFPKETI